MNSVQLPTGLTPYCRAGVPNSELGVLVEPTSIDVIDCCRNNCRPGIEYCFQHNYELFGPEGKTPSYEKYKQNFYSCEEMINDCQNNCFQYPSFGTEVIRNCSKKNGCDTFPFVDKKCMTEKKAEILECCKTTCLPENNIDCNHCEKFYDWMHNVNQDTSSSYSTYTPGSDDSSLLPIRNRYDPRKMTFPQREQTWYWKLPLFTLIFCIIILLTKNRV
jgi:hypothetical protein